MKLFICLKDKVNCKYRFSVEMNFDCFSCLNIGFYFIIIIDFVRVYMEVEISLLFLLFVKCSFYVFCLFIKMNIVFLNELRLVNVKL